MDMQYRFKEETDGMKKEAKPITIQLFLIQVTHFCTCCTCDKYIVTITDIYERDSDWSESFNHTSYFVFLWFIGFSHHIFVLVCLLCYLLCFIFRTLLLAFISLERALNWVLNMQCSGIAAYVIHSVCFWASTADQMIKCLSAAWKHERTCLYLELEITSQWFHDLFLEFRTRQIWKIARLQKCGKTWIRAARRKTFSCPQADM